MLEALGLCSGLLSIVSVVPYIKNILLRTTKPERATWLIWSVLGGIAFFSQLAKGATYSLGLTGAQTLGTIIVFLLSIRFGAGGLNKWDMAALAAAAFSLVLWYFTREPALALILVIIIDAIGSLLTIFKSYKNPRSETLSTWMLDGTSGICAAFAVGSFNYILLVYPVYICLSNFIIASSILLGRRKLDATITL